MHGALMRKNNSAFQVAWLSKLFFFAGAKIFLKVRLTRKTFLDKIFDKGNDKGVFLKNQGGINHEHGDKRQRRHDEDATSLQ